jgi:hypothetical protein
MRNKVLYFPYIRVPKSEWLTRMLLYWDEVGTIVPYEYIESPDRLGEHTRSLVEHCLVTQVIPGMYIDTVPQFVEAFYNYLRGLGDQLEQRRERFDNNETFQIHIEKLDQVGELLKDEGLACLHGYPWYHVEIETGHDFMCYLATVLGKLDKVRAIPVTDSHKYLSRYLRSGVGTVDLERQLGSLRLEILERIFPSPKRPLTAGKLGQFKEKHGDKLRRLRRAVERELTVLADISEPSLRSRRLEIFLDEADQEIQEICSRMEETGFGEIVFGKFCAVMAAIPGSSAIFGLANALYGAFGGGPAYERPSEFAYAAYAQAELN